ncbi:MAG: SMC family ATPase [Lachnospiraceae bacterium]|nr:SMC family ATPase [Lachnospiraceae bacterium]
MKPLKLVMSAFVPFPKEVEIDFSKLGDSGIYLITGETGAGKTTIFDAITFALYGKASGNNRENDMLRSNYATPDVKTFVEMEFISRGKRYKVKRNPEYVRISKRGSGEAKEKGDAELVFFDGHPAITGYKAVTNAIEDIIGINREQFTQIAMIAQGDFLKLLLATTEERIEIFRKIFDTYLYRELQNRLKSEALKYESKYNDAQKSIRQYYNGVVCAEGGFLNDKLKNFQQSQYTSLSGEAFDIIEDIISDDEKRREECLNLIFKAENNLSGTNKTISNFERNEKTKNDIKEAEAVLKENELKLNAFSLEYEARLKEAPEREKIAVDIEKQSEKLLLFDELEAEEKGRDILEEKLRESEGKSESLKFEKDRLLNNIKTAKEESLSLADAEIEKIRLLSDKEKVESKKRELNELFSLVQEYKDLSNKLKEAQKGYELGLKKKEELKLEYDRIERLFLDEQAGILSSKLKEGERCPVCGSFEHPLPARMKKEAPTKEEFERAKESYGNISESIASLSENAGSIKVSLDLTHKSILQKSEALFEESEKSVTEKGREMYFALDREDKEIRIKIRTAEEKTKKKKEIDMFLSEAEKRQETIEEKIKNNSSSHSKTEADLVSKKAGISKLIGTLPFKSKEEALNNIKLMRNKKLEMENAFTKAKDDFESCKNIIAEKKAAIEALSGSLENMEGIDANKIYDERDGYLETLKKLRIESDMLNVRLNINKNAREGINKQRDDLEKIEKHFVVIKSLSDTANGKMPGKEKIMLETYIQMAYFDNIISKANIRFMIMTDGQYELLRKIGSGTKVSQSGLELDVVDHYNGTVRSVKTLSGGESFMASLSLALGLSDEIQSHAGGIKLDSMFVDEGFGSLDDETLNQAIRILAELSQGNRIIGIISHVGELKEKIDKQIVVKKERLYGSSVEIKT